AGRRASARSVNDDAGRRVRGSRVTRFAVPRLLLLLLGIAGCAPFTLFKRADTPAAPPHVVEVSNPVWPSPTSDPALADAENKRGEEAEAGDDSGDVAGEDDADVTADDAEGESHEVGTGTGAYLYTTELSDELLAQTWKQTPAKLGSISLGFVDQGRLL